MKREEMLLQAREGGRVWDLLVIGGGATGLGIAVDAASRGHSVLLLERDDFAKGTSSRSTKLIHGGVRYLRQGNVALVIEALKERGRLRRNAPHLVRDLAFVVPSYAWWESPFYGVGLKLYDLLAGECGFGASRHLSEDEVVAAIPTIETEGLLGGTRYFDGQFDDARLAIALARTAADHGAVLLNYCAVVALRKTLGLVRGAVVRDAESGEEFEVSAKVVINATGPFCDAVRRLDKPDVKPLISPSQGTHLVLPRKFLPGDAAIMVPQTDDGRVMFAIPWQDRVVVGTTDIAVTAALPEPVPQAEEVAFLLATANRYLADDASADDVLSVFAGIRPLVSEEATSTASLSREHVLLIDPDSGLLTVAGGKWTTYRRMAEDAVDLAETLAELPPRPCATASLVIHGHDPDADRHGRFSAYGSDAPALLAMVEANPALGAPLHPELSLTGAEVVWACRHEMARKLEDVLARRSRSLLLDAAAACALAPKVAALMAGEILGGGRGEGCRVDTGARNSTRNGAEAWIAQEVAAFEALAGGYRLATRLATHK
ncbi:MAG: glycerol-3-phosphate dehydrogenase/oxidase [Betaproteobacteria bacterium]|nr:glycerol-3-phosphate dehydrogenase/oxidase [Betaproteobacteria bacterium]